MGLRDFTLYNIFQRNAHVFRDRISLVGDEDKIKYDRLLKTIDLLAYGISGNGVLKGDRIAVIARNSLRYVYLYGAAAKLGAVMVPINWRLGREELKYVISDLSPRMIFASHEFQTTAASLLSELGFRGSCFSMDVPSAEFTEFDVLTETDMVSPPAEIKSDDACVILQTAAVDGRPRGAVLSHRGLILSCLQLMLTWQLTPNDRNLVVLPLFHITALMMLLCTVQAGGQNVVVPKFDADSTLKAIETHKITLFGEFPPMLKTVLDKSEGQLSDLSSLRHVGGVEIPETVERLQSCTRANFWPGYGQSETHGLISMGTFLEKPGSAGKPCLMAEIDIVDEYQRTVTKGKTGEIIVRGPLVFNGYWNLDDETEHTFRDGWHHTGDLGRFDEDGYLWYCGRTPAKELIKPGGENVYPAEVEKVLLGHPDVTEAVVIGVDDPHWGEAVKAICVLRKGATLTENELVEFVASRIARFKKPKHVVFVQRLPKTEHGMIDRESVKAQYGAAPKDNLNQ